MPCRIEEVGSCLLLSRAQPGASVALLGTTGRFLAKPTEVSAVSVTQEFSHPVSVGKRIPSGTGKDVLAASGEIVTIVPQILGPEPKVLPQPRTEAHQQVRVAVRATVKPSSLREDSDAEVQIDVQTDVAPTLRD